MKHTSVTFVGKAKLHRRSKAHSCAGTPSSQAVIPFPGVPISWAMRSSSAFCSALRNFPLWHAPRSPVATADSRVLSRAYCSPACRAALQLAPSPPPPPEQCARQEDGSCCRGAASPPNTVTLAFQSGTSGWEGVRLVTSASREFPVSDCPTGPECEMRVNVWGWSLWPCSYPFLI